MALPEEAKQKIIQLTNRKEAGYQQEQIKSSSIDPLLRMHPIPQFTEKLLYYKIDLMVFAEEINIKVNTRTEDSVRYNYENEDSMHSGTKGFMNMKGNAQFTNEWNYPSNVISNRIIEHPFYVDMIAKRKEFLKKYKGQSMIIEPYMSNLYLTGNKKEGIYNFANTVVAWEQNSLPELYVRIGDWVFHEQMPLFQSKKVRGKDCEIYTIKKTIRDFNPVTRSL